MSFPKTILLVLFLLGITSSINLYSQGNYKLENFGNKSILLNGNVTGSVSDLGLTYYNPSRLALVENAVFTINAKSYQLRTVTLTDAFGENEKLRNSEFNGIPSMVAGTFKVDFLENHKFAYSFISRYRTSVDLDYQTPRIEEDIFEEFEGDESFIGRVKLNNDQKEEWYGVTWAYAFSEKLSVGISGFFSTYKYSGSNELDYVALHSEDQTASYSSEISFNQESMGLYWKAGISYITSKKIELGLNINLPYWEIYEDGSFNYIEVFAGSSDEDIFTINELTSLKTKRIEPLSIAIGAGIPVGRNKLHLNVEWYNSSKLYARIRIPELDSDTEIPPELKFEEKLKAVVNFGLGAELYFSPKFKGYLSFSTDYSAFDTNANLFDLINQAGKDINFASNYFHYGGGIDLSMSWAELILGCTFSHSQSEFAQPVNFPTDGIDDTEGGITEIEFSRWRFIIGIEIPILDKGLKKLKGED
ncbi:MAG: hypothetical protein BM564_05800 [Bacteroidetes bacterium MedPE-SWsnd-G2]|nr:MAG: hypothetical protein BM564_05800 [Bacteroidetes bacterium MedPE-SWsnd-G2]